VEDIPALLRSASERQLPFLVIGAHAIVSLGFVRNTLDLDLLVPERTRSGWLDLLRECASAGSTPKMNLFAL
jgi:hypothetical protein